MAAWADTAAARDRAAAIRAEVAGGAKFEDVAQRESADSVSGARGGDLGRGPRGRFVPEFETAAYALEPGELSQPVQTQFGYHVIRVDEKKGDTLALRHILVRIGQSDSTAAQTTHTYTTSGTHTASLRVSDGGGATGTDSVTISVGNSAPVATINAPTAGTTWKVGDVVGFSGSATDAQDGSLPPSAFS